MFQTREDYLETLSLLKQCLTWQEEDYGMTVKKVDILTYTDSNNWGYSIFLKFKNHVRGLPYSIMCSEGDIYTQGKIRPMLEPWFSLCRTWKRLSFYKTELFSRKGTDEFLYVQE